MSHISAAALRIDAADDDAAPPMFLFPGQSLNGLQFGLMRFLLAAGLTLVFGTILISAPAATSLNDGIARMGLAVVPEGWRAADARHRPHADEEPALADPRRGDSTQLAADPGLWHRCMDVQA